MESREEKRVQIIAPQFEHLNQVLYLASGATAGLSVLAAVVFGNPGVALAGLGSAGFSLYALAPSRRQAAQTAASLLISNDSDWEQKLISFSHQAQEQINNLMAEREAILVDRSEIGQKLLRTQTSLTSELNKTHTELAHRQQHIDALTIEIQRWQEEKRSLEKALMAQLQQLEAEKLHTEQTLSAQLEQVQQSLEEANSRLNQKQHDLAIHLDAIEGEILAIWNPLYQGLIAICDRFDPSRPVSDLEYAGKPASLTESEKRSWRHYRESLNAYDADLRKRIQAMSEDCETHDEAYAFFLKLLEELTTNYCKLWANIRDLEIGTTHEAEKRAIYGEFESFRSEYRDEASQWFEKSSSVEEGLTYIEQSFQNEIASLQQRIVEAEQEIEQLQAPRKFRGKTSVDIAGNKIVSHFYSNDIILDAVESVRIPGGFQLRFKVDRNSDSTKLAESEFAKHCDHLGLWGLSQQPLDFKLDTANFLLSVNLFVPTDSATGKRGSLSEAKGTSSTPSGHQTYSLQEITERFHALDCYSAAEFEDVIRLKCVPRVRVVAGSTGGKSPLLELFACAIAQIHKGELWLINPIPGSPKDWFHVPGVVPPGSDGIQAAIAWLGKAHSEFKARRNDLPGTAQKPFITIVTDEINAIARDYEDLGTVIKDFYQLSDHTRMAFLTAGQGANVSGVSGGFKSTNKTGNASKLMQEDFQNATQVFTAAAAKVWIEKNLKGNQMNSYIERLEALNDLCQELNEAEGKSAYPIDPTSKKVSPDAYRVALVVSPREPNPFFIQIPPYSHYLNKLQGVSFPPGATITAPQENQIELGLISDGRPTEFKCEYCGHDKARRKGVYKSTNKPRYICVQCGRVPSSSPGLPSETQETPLT